MKSTPARKKAAAQRADLKARARALTMTTNAGQRKGVSLEPDETSKASPPSRSRSRSNLRGRSASLANLKVGRPGERPKGPNLTKPADADTFVRLRACGVPPLEAVVYFAKGDERLSSKQWAALALAWETHALTKAAWDRFHGGEWQTLDDDQRQDAALRLHLSQCAYLLYTTDVNAPDVAMGKVRYAKDTILAKIAIDKAGGTDDTFTQFLQTLTANATAGAPAIWKGGSPNARAQEPRLPDATDPGAQPEDYVRADDGAIGDEDLRADLPTPRSKHRH